MQTHAYFLKGRGLNRAIYRCISSTKFVINSSNSLTVGLKSLELH